MKKFTFKGVLDGFRSSVQAAPRGTEQEIQETLRSDHFQIKKVSRSRVRRGTAQGPADNGRARAPWHERALARTQHATEARSGACTVGVFIKSPHLSRSHAACVV